jgi:hypothetical protein
MRVLIAAFLGLLGISVGQQQPGQPILRPPDLYCMPPDQGVCNSLIVLPVADKRTMKREDYKLTDLWGGVRFDLDGDDIEEQTSWTAQDSHLAFLALDRNGNGKIDNGKELFGNYTTMGWQGGFAALNWENNGVPERRREMAAGWGNPVYDKLLLWEDANHNGLSEPEEICRFSDHYLAIDTVATIHPDPSGDPFGAYAAAVKEPGMRRMPYGRRDLYVPIYEVRFHGR